MSRTYRKNKGRNSLDKHNDKRYLQREDESHTQLHGVYRDKFWSTYGDKPKWIEYKCPWWDIGYGARQFVKLEGKERLCEWNKLHKDGTRTFTVGKHYKNKEWRKQRQHYTLELYKFKAREDYEIEYLGNPDSSWDAW